MNKVEILHQLAELRRTKDALQLTPGERAFIAYADHVADFLNLLDGQGCREMTPKQIQAVYNLKMMTVR